MVAFFQYSPIYILSVHLPPSVLEFGHIQEEWIRKEAGEVLLQNYCSHLLSNFESDIELYTV